MSKGFCSLALTWETGRLLFELSAGLGSAADPGTPLKAKALQVLRCLSFFQACLWISLLEWLWVAFCDLDERNSAVLGHRRALLRETERLALRI